MARARNRPALVAHGGAGTAGPGRRAARAPPRDAGGDAPWRGNSSRANGSALDAVVATVAALEDHPLFNAGYGSLLNSEGNVEMDASVMFAEPVHVAPASEPLPRQALRGRNQANATPTTPSQPARSRWSAACETRSCSRAP